MNTEQTNDDAHIQTIRAAVTAAFTDTDSTIGPDAIKAIVDDEWKAQTDRTMRALMEAQR